MYKSLQPARARGLPNRVEQQSLARQVQPVRSAHRSTRRFRVKRSAQRKITLHARLPDRTCTRPRATSDWKRTGRAPDPCIFRISYPPTIGAQLHAVADDKAFTSGNLRTLTTHTHTHLYMYLYRKCIRCCKQNWTARG